MLCPVVFTCGEMIRCVPVNEGVPFTRISGAVPLALLVFEEAQFCMFPNTIHPDGGNVAPLKVSSNNTCADSKVLNRIPDKKSRAFFIEC